MAATISELKDKINTKTVHFVLLSIATYGIYTILWLYKNYRVIDSTTKIKTANDMYVIWIAIFSGLLFWSDGLTDYSENIAVIIGGIFMILTESFYILWSFKAKIALEEYALNEHKLDLKMNVFYLVIFNTFYINYCINDLPEVQRKQQIISGKKDN